MTAAMMAKRIKAASMVEYWLATSIEAIGEFG